MERHGIVVLTNGMRRAPNLNEGWKPDLAAHMRVLAGVTLYDEKIIGGASPYLLISGGKINGATNPALSHVLGRVAASTYGVPVGDIFLEDRSVDTTENAEFSMDLIRQQGLENNLTLITSGYHLPRSKAAFKWYGANIQEALVAEDLVREISDGHEALVRAYEEDRDVKRTYVRNMALHAVFRMTGPRLLRWLAHRELDKKGERFVPAK